MQGCGQKFKKVLLFGLERSSTAILVVGWFRRSYKEEASHPQRDKGIARPDHGQDNVLQISMPRVL